MVRLTDDFGHTLGRFVSRRAALFELQKSGPGLKVLERPSRDGRHQVIVKAAETTFAALMYAKTYYVEPG